MERVDVCTDRERARDRERERERREVLHQPDIQQQQQARLRDLLFPVFYY